MSSTDISGTVRPASRVPGRGRLLYALRALLGRVERFAEHRASTNGERRWAARFCDDLSSAYSAGLDAPGAREALAAVDRRRAASRKGRP